MRPRLVIITYTIISSLLGIFLNTMFFTMLIPTVILIIVDFVASDFSYASTCPFGIFRNLKRVYTSDGKFYIYFRHKYHTYHLFQDKILWMKGITYNNYSTKDGEIEIEPVKDWVKAQVDVIYRQKRNQRKLRDSVNKWNGHIDKQTERDVKINEVLK